MIDSVVLFFKEGGIFLYLIFLVWIFGIVIGIERFLYLNKVGGGNKRLWNTVRPLFESGQYVQAAQVIKGGNAAIAEVLKYGMSRLSTARHRDDVEKAMEESLIEVIPDIERRTPFISSLANIVMLMGLFGTVTGLIRAFAAVGNANAAEKASMLSMSISEAMNNTASGLIAAITLLLIHMYIEAKTTNIVDSLEVATVKFLNTLTEARLQDKSLFQQIDLQPTVDPAVKSDSAANAATSAKN